MAWETVRFERQKLYEQVWSRPMQQLAAEYGMSDVGLAKVCRRLGVPAPGRGHWAKLEHGKSVDRPALTALRAWQQEEIVENRYQAPPADPVQQAEAEERIAAEKDKKNQIRVSDRLSSPHPLAAKTRAVLRKAGRDNRGMLFERLTRYLDISVSRKCLPRALRIMDALLKGLETRGFEAQIERSEPPRTEVVVLGEALRVRLEEGATCHEEQGEWGPRYAYAPNGRLALKITSGLGWSGLRRTWRDGKRQSLEKLLNSFLVGLMKAAVNQRAEHLERERERKVREERERQRQEAERRRQIEVERAKVLREHVEAWDWSRRVRGYVEALRQGRLADSTKNAREDWCQWALSYAEALDAKWSKAPDLEEIQPQEQHRYAW